MQQAQQRVLGGHELGAWEQMRLWGCWLSQDFLPDCYLRPLAQNASASDHLWEFQGLYAAGRQEPLPCVLHVWRMQMQMLMYHTQ